MSSLCKCRCAGCTRDHDDDEESREALIGREPADVVERYFGLKSSFRDRVSVTWQMRLAYGAPTAEMNPNRVIPMTTRPSPYVKGMQVYLPASTDDASSNALPPAMDGNLLGLSKPRSFSTHKQSDSHPDLQSLMSLPAETLKGKPVIVGTVRMGFGHHRIAYSAVTWALELGAQPHLIDILAVDCPEAHRVAEMDKAYSKFSRISSNIGGVVDAIWTRMLLQGGINSLRFSCLLAEQLKPLMADLPKDYPVIAAHPWIGQIAVACGFKTVINLVIDNYPQYFVLVPGAMNLTQSPSYYSKLLNMGIPAKDLKYAGHWVSRDIVQFATQDCEQRIARCQAKNPMRLLIAIGGAGAQQKYVQGVILGMRHLLESGRVKLCINSGDHGFMADNLISIFDREGLRYVFHRNQDELNKFIASHSLGAPEPSDDSMITIFNFDTHYAAFRATDLLMRVADVLATKPSELAFFPVPKLHLRHVGGHESFSAVRSCELGDGTVECETVPMALQHLELLAQEESPLLLQMNRSIIENDRAHVYDGSKVAIQMALATS